MKKYGKIAKVLTITLILSASLLIGANVTAASFPDNPVLQFFVIDNPFTTPQQDTFTAMQIFEENGFSLDRIDNVQLAVLPDGGVITVTGSQQIRAVWELLSNIELTAHRAEQARIYDELAIYVDFQFVDPNFSVAIEMFGQVYVLGRGPFVFAGDSSEQLFIDLFSEFSGVHVDIEIAIPLEQYNGYDYDVTEYPLQEESDHVLTYNTFLELLAENGFVFVSENLYFEGTPTGRRTVSIGGERLTVECATIEHPFDDLRPVIEITWVPEYLWSTGDSFMVIYSGDDSSIIEFLSKVFGDNLDSQVR